MIKFIIFNILISNCLSEFLVTNDGACTCDLTPNVCDIGCCCDTICTSFQLQSFTCLNTQISPISYGCLPVEVFFGNNTSFKIYNDGNQMCVYYDNYTLRNFYYTPNTTYATSFYTDSVSPPTSYKNFNPISTFNFNTYSFGSNIYSFQNPSTGVNSYIGYLSIALPSAKDGSCIDGVAIQYLQNQVVNCSRSINSPNPDECQKLPGVNLYNKTNLLIASFPSAIIAAYDYSTNLTSSGNFIVPSISCKPEPCNSTVASYNNSHCINVVSDVNITISGETGISSVSISLTIGSFNTTFNQSSSVTFNKIGYSSKTPQYSGNPGYITGKPLIGFNNFSYSGDWLIPNGGPCSNIKKSTILFGYNVETDCYYNVSSENSTVVSALNSSIPDYISSFGNNFSFNAERATVYRNSVGTGPILQKQSIYIAYARNGTLTLPQNKIVGVQVNNTFSTGSSNAYQTYVSISVSFIDVSQTSFDVNAAVIKSRSGRSVRDFLYLLYVENQAVAGNDMNNCYLLLLISLLFIVRFCEI